MPIAALFATMNRSATAVACVKALAAQTRPPDLVIVADNVSADTTVADLESLTNLPFPLIVHRMTENLGNAGGMESIMELAFARGMDAVWLLDDDSWPRPDALKKLMGEYRGGLEVVHSIQIDPKSRDLTWPMQVHDSSSGWRTVHSLRVMGDQALMTTRNNWTGSLVPRNVREIIGPVKGDLFIRGEDEEYPWRFHQAGINQRAVIASVLDHPGPEDLRRMSVLGKTIYFEPGLSNWKYYYKIRNMVWIKKEYKGPAKALLMAAAYFAATLRYDGLHRLPLWLEATRDGWLGKLGRWEKHG